LTVRRPLASNGARAALGRPVRSFPETAMLPDAQPVRPPAAGDEAAAATGRRRRLWRGGVLFVACTAAGLWLAHDRSAWSRTAATLAAAHPGWLALGVVQAGLDAFLGGARIWTCARAIGGRIGLSACALANTGNVFVGAMTPSQTGGGPAQIVLLVRGGLSLAQATVASAGTFLGTIVVFLAVAMHVVSRGPSNVAAPVLAASTATIGVFALLGAGCLLALPQPRRAGAVVRAVLGHLPWGGSRLAERVGRDLDAWLADLRALLHLGLRRGGGWLAASLGLSALVYLNKFAIGWVAARALGVAPAFADMLRLQELQALATYFAPTPGAAGIAEVSAATILADAIPAASLGAYLVVWRTCSVYLEMLAGGIVLLCGGARARAKVPRASIPEPAPRR
jgi:uncharacterized protein (TIRG00374 family)